jgi:hypothetical protein
MRLLSLSLLLICVTAAAEEKPPAEGEGGSAAAIAPVGKDQKEYIEKTGKLTSLSNRIVEFEKQFQEVIHHKATAKTTAEKMHAVEELNRIAKERNKDVEAYNRIKMDVKLRYPNQGISLERRYNTQQKKTVEELEGAAGLDEMLTRIKRVIDQKYEPFLAEEEKREKKQPTIVKSLDEEKPKRLRLEK